MAQTALPYGLYPRRCGGGRRLSGGTTSYPVVVNNATAIYWGAPVIMVAGGGVGPATATPASGAQVVGLMAGASWVEAGGTPRWGAALPAGAVTAGCKNISVMVNDDPGLVMLIQSDATLDNTKVGFVAALKDFTLGNNVTGRSTAALTAAAASGDKAVRIISIIDPGAPFPDCLVQWNANVSGAQMAAGVSAPEGDSAEEKKPAAKEYAPVKGGKS